MYQEKKYKVGRRLGAPVLEKCQTPKFAASLAKRAKTGSEGGGRGSRKSDYGVQLIDKQRVRVMYGVSEKQFYNYVKEASATAVPATTLFELLESRLDNVVYRLGFAPTRRMARQVVSHGHVLVNGVRSKVASYRLKAGDTVAPREASKKTSIFSESERFKNIKAPTWLTFDNATMKGTVKGRPIEPDPFLNFPAVVEFYRR